MRTNTEAAPTAAGIAEQVRSGQRTAQDVLGDCFARIAATDDRIGAFQALDPDGARRAADALHHRSDLRELPLAGVPVAIKDNIAVAGLPTRYGSAATSALPAREDDELVRRIREAGAIIVGTTRMPELAIWGFTESIAHGGTRNPRDLSRNAGGSTGGGAAAVAAGMVPLAIGSDGGGSLRIPAANCGVVGFKPAPGTIPLAGGAADHWFGCTSFGPIAVTVADAALAVDVLSGGESWRGQDTEGPLRIAVSLRSPSPLGPPDATAKASTRTAAALAEKLGHRVVRADPPYPVTLINAWVRHWIAGVAVEAGELGLPIRELEPRTRTAVERGRKLIRRGHPRPAAAAAWRERALAWFEDVDVLLTPVIARPAPLAGSATGMGYRRAYLDSAHRIPFTQAWNLAGFPALSLPMGAGAVQVIAAPGRESALLRVAAGLERHPA